MGIADSNVGIGRWIWLYSELLDTHRELQRSLVVNIGRGTPVVDEVSVKTELAILHDQFERLDERLSFWIGRSKAD